ncbi:hypothetical protein CEXT_234671 [Caerostris extrusa]|uniref:Uncharacterized protein n=1 Tax=Caerostris extrusa TaxID=172846 RepID=A0AAV4PC89_CAEEX|nr:hypothetical protein CEXT_234671 [Caerostris extrusa]
MVKFIWSCIDSTMISYSYHKFRDKLAKLEAMFLAHGDKLCLNLAPKISRKPQTVENIINSSDIIACIDKTFVNTNLIIDTSDFGIITISDLQSLLHNFEIIS